jgi:hypothetical protein
LRRRPLVGSDDPGPTNPRSQCRSDSDGGGSQAWWPINSATPALSLVPSGYHCRPALSDTVASQQCHPPSMEVASHSLLHRRMHPTSPHLCLMPPL